MRLHFKPESYIHTCIRVFKQYIDYFQRASSYEPGWPGWLGYRDEFSLRSWRYCVGARLKFWRRSRVPKKGVGTRRLKYPLSRGSAVKSHSTILQRLRRQISLDYCTIPPATQARMNFALGSYEKVQPCFVSEMRKGQRSWGRVLTPYSGNKTNIAKHKHFSFRAYLSIGNS